LAQIHVIRCLLKSQSPAVVQVHRKLGRETCGQGKRGAVSPEAGM
jgi:hypothetical protein